MRGVTPVKTYTMDFFEISTHTPHARRDIKPEIFIIPPPPFQLTRLMRGVTDCHRIVIAQCEFQLTRLMRGVTLYLV